MPADSGEHLGAEIRCTFDDALAVARSAPVARSA